MRRSIRGCPKPSLRIAQHTEPEPNDTTAQEQQYQHRMSRWTSGRHAGGHRAGRGGGAGGGSFGRVRPMALALAKLVVMPLATAMPLGLGAKDMYKMDDESPKSADDPNLWVYLGVALALVLLGGAFAGLTIALMGQDETYLQVIASSGEGSEKKHATSVLRLLKRGKHWVLVTLLLSNVITNETLPIVLDRSLGGGWPAVLGSTVAIVIFGEIVPQSICVRFGLPIGAYCAPFVLVLMYIMFPVAWPTAKLLDYLLGEDHGIMYKKAGLKTLVQLHKTLGTAAGERLMEDEVTIINSVLDLKDKPVGDIMTPMGDVFIMSADTVLDERMMDTILSQGYSRIPVHDPEDQRNFFGMLLVKILITYDPEDCMRVRDFALATLPETAPHTSCLDIINFFQEGKSHMVLVSDNPGSSEGAIGVVTLEDVIEELIGEEIIDESDVFIDVHKAIRRLHPAPKQKFKTELAEDLVSESDRECKEQDENTPLLARDLANSRGRASSGSNGHPGTTFMARRKSSNASESTHDTVRPLTLRNGTVDLREHLKHLGPSNAASKPRATKFTSVKIKPGVGTIPEHKATTLCNDTPSSRPATSPAPSATITETSRLLDGNVDCNAGPVASDGAAAVAARYGSVSPAQRRLSSDNISASEASRIARENTTPSSPAPNQPSVRSIKADSFKLPEKLVVGGEQTNTTEAAAAEDDDRDDDKDTVGDLEAPSRKRVKPRRAARSGSITETTVDVNGMKKVVLETTSSSDDLHDDAQNDGGVGLGASGFSLNPGGSNSQADLLRDEEACQDHESSGTGTEAGMESKPKKKRKNRTKKKKGGSAA